MKFQRLDIPEVIKIIPTKFSDSRGFFMETFRSSNFQDETGVETFFLQDNQSSSFHAGTVRGLHFQSPPMGQGKLVRCTRGALLDVAVDVRAGSPTYGQHVKVELSQENGVQLWIPEGFLHGFVTLKDQTDISYKCTNYYSSEHDGAVFWNDPDLKIDWGVSEKEAFVSDKDKSAQSFANFKSPFTMVGVH